MKKYAIYYIKNRRQRVTTITANSEKEAWEKAVSWARKNNYSTSDLEVLEIS